MLIRKLSGSGENLWPSLARKVKLQRTKSVKSVRARFREIARKSCCNFIMHVVMVFLIEHRLMVVAFRSIRVVVYIYFFNYGRDFLL